MGDGSSASAGPPASRLLVCPIPGGALWVREEAAGPFTVGLTRATGSRLGTVAHFRGPAAGDRLAEGRPAASLESDKWVGHLAAPASGVAVETNPAALEDPTLIARDPEGAGWLYRFAADRPEELRRRLSAPAAPGGRTAPA